MKNWKKCLSLLLTLALVLGIGGTALADEVTGLEDETVSVTIDGEDVELADANGESVAPVIIDGSTYLPIRAVAEALGLDVDWDRVNREVQLTTGGQAASAAVPVEMVAVKGAVGTVVGYEDNGLYAFRGIPYATAERFQSPKPVTEYPNGTFVALTYGEVSPQDRTLSATGATNPFEFATPSNGTADMVGNETCQYLNVWSSDLTAKKPVVVFFHGGGLSNGASTELSYYTGEYMVQQQDVVFVSVNHRLNVLGYLDMSAYGDQFADSAIVGMQDCVVALQWVHDNIAAMGGDPDNVTIVGQSGGGVKVSTLACMSDTVDLFDKVFVMSGGYSNNDKATGLANTQKLVDHLGLSEGEVAETLVNMNYEELLTAATEAGCSWTTCYGNGTFEAPFLDSDGNINQYAAQRKWMIGTTFSEFSGDGIAMLMSGNPDMALSNISDSAALARLTETYGDNAQAIADAFQAAYPTKSLANILYINTMPAGLMGRAGLINQELPKLNAAGVDVYNYVVAYNFPYMGGMPMHHSGDIGYWFYAISTIPYQIRGDEKNAFAVSDAMSSALAAFAATGDPSTAELEWKPWTADEHNTMVFDSKSELKVDFDAELYSLMLAQ